LHIYLLISERERGASSLPSISDGKVPPPPPFSCRTHHRKMKLAKDVTTHLFKYVKVVDIRFNPFDGRSKSVKELLRQVQATRYSKANPNLEIKRQILATADAPFATFQFVDGSEVSVAVTTFQCICPGTMVSSFPLQYVAAHAVSMPSPLLYRAAKV